MINKGANPYIVQYNGNTWTDETAHLSNLPTQKSIYFTTRSLPGNDHNKPDFLDPWFYRTGVFDGEFDSVIGKGTSGIVISGEWLGKKAAFKFVQTGNQKLPKDVPDALKTLDEKLSEMTTIQATQGSKIVQFYGLYR